MAGDSLHGAIADEIRVEGNAATISGSYGRLIAVMPKEKEDTVQAPSFMRDWRARRDESGHWHEIVSVE